MRVSLLSNSHLTYGLPAGIAEGYNVFKKVFSCGLGLSPRCSATDNHAASATDAAAASMISLDLSFDEFVDARVVTLKLGQDGRQMLHPRQVVVGSRGGPLALGEVVNQTVLDLQVLFLDPFPRRSKLVRGQLLGDLLELQDHIGSLMQTGTGKLKSRLISFFRRKPLNKVQCSE